MSFNIEVQGGSSVRLPTAGKYCDRDIVVTATGGGGAPWLDHASTNPKSTRPIEELSGVRLRLLNVESIEYNAFHSWTGLLAVDLPKATYIDAGAFSHCKNLSTVILRTTKEVCIADPSAFFYTKIITGDGYPLGTGFIYVPTSMFDAYRATYEPMFAELGAAGLFDILFRKIEDYPEICG